MSTNTFSIIAFREGDERSFAALYDQHSKTLLSIARNFVRDHDQANICISEAFLSLWQNRLKITGEDHIKPFLIRATVNRAKNMAKFNGLQTNWEYAIFPEELDDVKAEAIIMESEIMAAIVAGLDRLSPAEKIVMTEAWIHGRTDDEIAERLDKPKTHIRTVISKAKKKMKPALAKSLLSSVAWLWFPDILMMILLSLKES